MATDLTALLEGPAAKPPNGLESNLDNPPNQRIATYAVPIVSLAFTTLSVCMHVYSRLGISRKFGFVIDGSILLGFGLFIGFCVAIFTAGEIAPGIHTWDLRLGDLGQFNFLVRIGSMLYTPTIFFIKLSILWQYVEVFMPSRRGTLYWTTIFLIVANIVCYIAILALQIWSCKPMEKAWDPLITEGECIDVMSLYIGAVIINIVSDTAILILPQTVIWRLNMPLRQRVAVSMMFLVAILAIASAAIRLYFQVQLRKTNDIVWYSWVTGIWSLVEMDFGVIVVCMPAGGIFFKSVGKTRWYANVSKCLKGLGTSKGMMTNEEPTSGYALESRFVGDDSQSGTRTKSWTRYGKPGSIPNGDSESARNLRTDDFHRY